MRRVGVVLLAAGLVLAACTATTPGSPASTATPAATSSGTTEAPPPLPTSPATEAGEVPAALLDEIVADAASRSGVADADIEVVRGESVTWSDGSLGCPQPGMNYTQALVPGYWVVLGAGGTEFDYRATERDGFRLCEGGGTEPSLGSADR